jgi:hypothetical protein
MSGRIISSASAFDDSLTVESIIQTTRQIRLQQGSLSRRFFRWDCALPVFAHEMGRAEPPKE